MDVESLTLIINGFNKARFETAVGVTLNEILLLDAINTEQLSLKKGTHSTINSTTAYYMVLDKGSFIDKDSLKKKIRKYKLTDLYVLFKFNRTQGDLTKQELLFKAEFGVSVTCLSSKTISELIIEAGKESFLFDDVDVIHQINSSDFDYIAAVFHSMTVASPDVIRLKGQVYDDAILFKAATTNYESKEELINDVIKYLNLPSDKSDLLGKRLDSLQSKGQIHKEDGFYKLLPSVNKDIECRKKAYLYELESLSSSQTDLMREDFHVEWTINDSKTISTLLALSAIDDKIRILREAKSDIEHPIFKIAKGSDQKIIKYLEEKKGLEINDASNALEELAQLASNHPLILKITRACMYLALEGSNPLSSVKALGANSWKEFNIMLEPTVAIPYICAQIYDGKVTKPFESSVNSVRTAVALTRSVSIPYFYINECAGHLLAARRYNGLDLDPIEMMHSNNAFVSNYYSLLNAGYKLPPSFLDYLATFSSAIKIEKTPIKKWVREIMIDFQSMLQRGNVIFQDLPKYMPEDLKDYDNEFSFYLQEHCKDKPDHLIHHDAMALKFINDQVSNKSEHWIILSYDGMLTSVGNKEGNCGWVCNPKKFLDLTNITVPLSDTAMVSVLHSVASFSEKTLAIGAQIMDRIIQYAAKDMQRWEFKLELDKFKKEMKESLSNLEDPKEEVIKRTDKFLKDQGIDLHEDEIESALEA